ncbi:hypothetical protein FGB62_95g093 [Gracilaria domingensis]|nr:hypothetical protein FGB62_95g093 [Gracilaria domingensis]
MGRVGRRPKLPPTDMTKRMARLYGEMGPAMMPCVSRHTRHSDFAKVPSRLLKYRSAQPASWWQKMRSGKPSRSRSATKRRGSAGAAAPQRARPARAAAATAGAARASCRGGERGEEEGRRGDAEGGVGQEERVGGGMNEQVTFTG